MCVLAYVCTHIIAHTHAHMYIYIYINMSVRIHTYAHAQIWGLARTPQAMWCLPQDRPLNPRGASSECQSRTARTLEGCQPKPDCVVYLEDFMAPERGHSPYFFRDYTRALYMAPIV